MRILIYSDSVELLQGLRDAGHRASLRNPQYFTESEIEKCDAFIATDKRIIEAHAAAGIPFALVETQEKPAKRRRKK
jgi:hypothetical protein